MVCAASGPVGFVMESFFEKLIESVRAGRPVAETVLVATRGSTPQKAGARMLVFADGAQLGTLGGGCVEAEVKRTALECLQSGKATISDFLLDNDYGWDDGLICGGRMTALIDPILSTGTAGYAAAYLQCLQEASGCTEAIALSAEADRRPSRFLFDAENQLRAQTNGSDASPSIAGHLKPLDLRPLPYVAGEFAYLPTLPRCQVVIVGGGHVGQSLARYARDADFDVTVVDDRRDYCNPDRIPEAGRHLVGRMDDVLPQLSVCSQTACVIVTRGHNHDEEALLHLIRKQPGYLGMIGSRRKIRLIFDDLLREGIPEMDLARVHAPIGLDIGSRTVPEIAISIVAELIAWRNLRGSRKTVESDHA